MIRNDMKKRMELARAKIYNALELGGGHTILSTGITGDDSRLARAVTDVGVKMIEPNHPAVALARGHRGVVTMHAAEQIRHEITVDQMAEVTRGVRAVCPADTYITVGIPGGFTEVVPMPLKDEDFMKMALAGADGLHTHKSCIEDLAQLVETAHKYGLLVDAYIGKASDLHTFGLPAKTPEEVARTAKLMEDVGTDMIGLMTGMSYEGVDAGDIHPEIKERLQALVETVHVPTLAEGGINITNFQAFKDTKVNILVIGTSIDKMVEKAAQQAVKEFLSL
ncbi:MAG: histidine biosynthesis protein [Candidatus Faecousia sp.]|nr:histidine biosynthesis protein [Bacillota bacterium]MDY4219465.1 histidine biosynthesis protein [Candidatus Faecousia sp.]